MLRDRIDAGSWRTLTPTTAGALTIVVFLLMAWALAAGSGIEPSPAAAGDGVPTDLKLYRAITDRVADGEDYYRAAVEEQILHGFPVQPTATVRLPTLVVVSALLGSQATYALLLVLTGAVAVGALVRFERLAISWAQWMAMLAFLALGLLVVAAPQSMHYAEPWAFLLTTLSLLVGADRRPFIALLLATAALALREHAAIFMCVIATWLWLTSRHRLALLWALIPTLATVLYVAFHAPHVSAAVAALGPAAETAGPGGGWLDFGGWPRVVDYVRSTTPLAGLPYAVTAIIAPLSALGWFMRHDRWATPAFVATAAYCTAFMLVGRANNLYWGFLFAPLLLPGLAFAPGALKACLTSVRRAFTN